MLGYLKTIMKALDVFAGAFIPGAYYYETISSRAFRENWAAVKLIDMIFFWDDNHCEESYWNGVKERNDFKTI